MSDFELAVVSVDSFPASALITRARAPARRPAKSSSRFLPDYRPGDHVDNLWPRLYDFMQQQYNRGTLKYKPLRLCPETNQEYDCTNIIPEPGTPVILCKFPPHRATIKIVP
jgi:hypothetical protein